MIFLCYLFFVTSRRDYLCSSRGRGEILLHYTDRVATPKRYHVPVLWAWLEYVSPSLLEKSVLTKYVISCHMLVSK